MIEVTDDDMLNFMGEYLRSYIHNPPTTQDITFGYSGMAREMITGEGTVTAELSYSGMNKLVAMHKQATTEAAIRSKNETVQHAYEQYQILLKLAQ